MSTGGAVLFRTSSGTSVQPGEGIFIDNCEIVGGIGIVFVLESDKQFL